jgi:hypothetical protein
MTDSPIPQDAFSRERRRALDNPGACRASSTIDATDFYGNTETWIVETFRVDGADLVFLQRSSAAEPIRLHLPADITRALARHRDVVAGQAQRAAGHRLIALRKQRGDRLGNPEALKKARRAKKK